MSRIVMIVTDHYTYEYAVEGQAQIEGARVFDVSTPDKFTAVKTKIVTEDADFCDVRDAAEMFADSLMVSIPRKPKLDGYSTEIERAVFDEWKAKKENAEAANSDMEKSIDEFVMLIDKGDYLSAYEVFSESIDEKWSEYENGDDMSVARVAYTEVDF